MGGLQAVVSEEQRLLIGNMKLFCDLLTKCGQQNYSVACFLFEEERRIEF